MGDRINKIYCPRCNDVVDRSRYDLHMARHADCGESCPIDAVFRKLADIFRR